jgi:hypothetical protein
LKLHSLLHEPRTFYIFYPAVDSGYISSHPPLLKWGGTIPLQSLLENIYLLSPFCDTLSRISSFLTSCLQHLISYLVILNLQSATHHPLSLHSQLDVCDTSSLVSSFSTSCLRHLISPFSTIFLRRPYLCLPLFSYHLLSLHSQIAVCDTSSLIYSFSASCLRHLISYLFNLNLQSVTPHHLLSLYSQLAVCGHLISPFSTIFLR